jgi:hypothetical protein
MAKKYKNAGKDLGSQRTANSIMANIGKSEFERKAKIRHELQIHPKLEPYIPPLKQEEYETLAESILSDGKVRENLLVWETQEEGQTKFYLLDGHHRYKIVTQNAARDITWDITVQEDIADLNDAKRFMRKLQLGRRNLTSNQMAYLRGRTYHDMKHEAAGRPEAERSGLGKTKEILAVEFKVGTSQIQRDAWFCKAIDRFRDKNLPEEIQAESDRILLNESDFLKGEIELLGKHLDIPLELAFKYKKAGGDLRSILKLPEKEQALAMQTFLGEENVPSKDERNKPEKKASAPSPADRFEKWWKHQKKELGKVFKTNDIEAIQAKKQELLEQEKMIKELLKEFEQLED